MKKQQIPKKETVIAHMKMGTVNFKFEKKNGELREMNGTLMNTVIPGLQHKETSPNPHTNPDDLVVCWDTDASGWRSFNLSKLTEYNGKA
jgi:hypothetical protein|tara:strand:- start:1053 stop:1322 length:270 start_codon:yes stop_codon:yes gene_type:complete